MDPTTSLFSERLVYAPFPNDGECTDSGRDVADRVKLENRALLHIPISGGCPAQGPVCEDHRVLFFVPPDFDPLEPFFYLVFFHGFRTTAARTLKDFRLIKQVTAARRNGILIVPQLAVNAEDSSPGKFYRKGIFRFFMAEAADMLSEKIDRRHASRFAEAPIILSAFSGGYKSVAYVLDRGRICERIQGVLLLDALYGELERFGNWIEKNLDKSFFSLIYTRGLVEENAKRLAAQLAKRGIRYEKWRPDRVLKPGRIYLTPSDRAHEDVPLAGPPEHPLQQMLEDLRI